MHIDHVGVLVGDLERAKAFARDVLGLGEPGVEFEAPEHGLAGAFFALGGARLELFNARRCRRGPAGGGRRGADRPSRRPGRRPR